MGILIDGIELGRPTGVARLVEQFLQGVGNGSGRDEYSVVVRHDSGITEQGLSPGVKVIPCVTPGTRVATYQLWFPRYVRRHKPDAVVFFSEEACCVTNCPFLVVITEIRERASLPRQGGMDVKRVVGDLWARFNTPRTLGRASALVAISEFTKHEACDAFRLAPSRIAVVYPSVDAVFREKPTRNATEIRHSVDSDEGYILGICKDPERDKPEVLLQAFACALQNGCRQNLVMCGRHGGEDGIASSIARTLNIKGRCSFLGFVSDPLLRDLYVGADAYVDTSVFEGFGLQVLEAMTCGCAVIHGDSSSLTEVSMGSALVCDSSDVSQYAEAIIRIALGKDYRSKLARSGAETADRFSARKWASGIHSALSQARRAL